MVELHATVLGRLHGREASPLRTSQLPPRVARFATEAEITDGHVSALALWLGGGSLMSASAWTIAGSMHGAVFVIAVVAIPLVVARRWRGRRTRRLIAELPDMVDVVGRSLRSGSTLTQALAETAKEGPRTIACELTRVVAGLEQGQDMRHALQAWAQQAPIPELRIVAAALAVASRNEAGTTRALDGVSHSLRDRAALKAELRAHSAQAAASMQALVCLPAVFLAFDLGSGQRTVQFLTSHRVGQLCLLAAIMLNLVGWWWMSSIMRRRSPR